MRSITLSLLMGLLSFACSCSAQPTRPPTGTGFAVVELFTSEGCSSCPPAERVLQELQQRYGDKINILEFHVDYWNQLGWKEIFSDHNFTIRQQQYAQNMNLNGNYTPQAIVNGTKQMVGSDKSKLTNTIDAALTQKAGNTIKVTAIEKNGAISINFAVSGAGDNILNLALVQKNVQVNIKNGENEGQILKHANVVREFRTLPRGEYTGTQSLTLPKGLSASGCKIIAYTQQKNSGLVTGATEIGIN